MNDDEFLSTASILNIPMNKKILKASFKLMNNYINEHAKTLVIREDIHLPEGTEQEAWRGTDTERRACGAAGTL